MIDANRFPEVVELHHKSYDLLRWVRASLQKGVLSFSVVHTNTDTAAAAEEWISRHMTNLPADVRPRADQVPTFAKLFISFLTTSYRLKSNSVRMVDSCCCCSSCAYLQAGPNLEARTPSKKDSQTAHQLKRIYLRELADELGSSNAAQIPDLLLGRKESAESIARATWGRELMRRSEFASQGEAVLTLWRQCNWNVDGRNWGADGKPRNVTAKEILAAQDRIIDAIRAGDTADSI